MTGKVSEKWVLGLQIFEFMGLVSLGFRDSALFVNVNRYVLTPFF